MQIQICQRMGLRKWNVSTVVILINIFTDGGRRWKSRKWSMLIWTCGCRLRSLPQDMRPPSHCWLRLWFEGSWKISAAPSQVAVYKHFHWHEFLYDCTKSPWLSERKVEKHLKVHDWKYNQLWLTRFLDYLDIILCTNFYLSISCSLG